MADHAEYECEDCGWRCRLMPQQFAVAECDNCGGELVVASCYDEWTEYHAHNAQAQAVPDHPQFGRTGGTR